MRYQEQGASFSGKVTIAETDACDAIGIVLSFIDGVESVGQDRKVPPIFDVAIIADLSTCGSEELLIGFLRPLMDISTSCVIYANVSWTLVGKSNGDL